MPNHRQSWSLRYHQALLDLARTDLSLFTPAVRHFLETDAVLLDVERVSFWTCDNDRKGITCRDLYTKSTDSHEEGGHLDAPGHPVYFHELGEQRLITADDVKEHFCTKELFEDYLKPHGITSILDVPVWLNGHVIGIVCHEHVGKQRTWNEKEQEFATSVADYISLALETSKRHQIEEILRESETTTGALLDATHEAAVLVTDTGIILKLNEVAAKWFHMNMDDVLETNLYQIVPEDYAAALKEQVNKAVRGGTRGLLNLQQATGSSKIPLTPYGKPMAGSGNWPFSDGISPVKRPMHLNLRQGNVFLIISSQVSGTASASLTTRCGSSG